MTLTCTSRYAGHGARCQDRQHTDDLHHGHTDDQCLQWADGGVHFSRPIGSCPWPPAHEVEQRAGELAAKIKARRERLTATAVEHPDDELLRAEIDRLRYEENRATPAPGPCPIPGCGWDAEGTLDEHLYEHDYNELRPTVARLALENDQLRTGPPTEALTAQHPFLTDLQPPDVRHKADLYTWLFNAEQMYGETLPVRALTDWVPQEPIQELVDRVELARLRTVEKTDH